MPKIMIIIASVRPGRIGKPIGDWVVRQFEGADAELDVVDLAELALPFMDEPQHPRLREYTHEHTKAWSARVDAADAFVFVTPEYNFSFAPALANALDFLFHEWTGKSVAFVSYGGVSAGTRGVAAIASKLMSLQLHTLPSAHIPFASPRVEDGVFSPPAELVESFPDVVDAVITAAADRLLRS